MRTLLTISASVFALSFAPIAHAECDPPSIASTSAVAERLERRRALGEAITLRTALLGCPRGEHSAGNSVALARAHASLGEFARAAELIEDIAPRAADKPRVAAAMGQAVRYRIALREPHRAQADVLWLFAATGHTDATVAGAFDVGAAFEELRMWTEATQWYHRLATRFAARSQSGTYARALTGMGRAYSALGDVGSARRSWAAVIARWTDARGALGRADLALEVPQRPALPERPRPPRRGGMSPASSGIVSPFGAMTESGLDVRIGGGNMSNREPSPVLSAFAEAQFRLASQVAGECLRVVLPPFVGASRAAFELWQTNELERFMRFRQRCIDTIAPPLETVIRLGETPWQIAAAAVLSEQFFRHALDLRNAPIPPDRYPRHVTR